MMVSIDMMEYLNPIPAYPNLTLKVWIQKCTMIKKKWRCHIYSLGYYRNDV